MDKSSVGQHGHRRWDWIYGCNRAAISQWQWNGNQINEME
jgi:hypothetical protein